MSRLFWVLLGFIILLSGLQWMVPSWVGRASAAWLGQHLHGPRPAVEISAIPFWRLGRGQFQLLVVRGYDLTVSGIVLHAVHLTWQNGQVGLSAKGQPVKVLRAGRIDGQVSMTAFQVARLIDQKGILSKTRVAFQGQNLMVSGVLPLAGRRVPITVRGPLVLGHGGTAVTFRPRVLDSATIPLSTSITVLQLSAFRLPIALKLTRLYLHQGQLTVNFQNRYFRAL